MKRFCIISILLVAIVAVGLPLTSMAKGCSSADPVVMLTPAQESYCLRKQLRIRAVDNQVDWGTTCDVELGGLAVGSGSADCKHIDVLSNKDTLQIVHSGSNYGLLFKDSGDGYASYTGPRLIPMFQRLVPGSTDVQWLSSDSASPLSIGGNDYDVRVYLLDQARSPKQIEKRFLVELFNRDTKQACDAYEPEKPGSVKAVPSADPCIYASKRDGTYQAAETQEGDGKEHQH